MKEAKKMFDLFRDVREGMKRELKKQYDEGEISIEEYVDLIKTLDEGLK